MSFGTFSCTLEGFDNPFETMKSVADYLQGHASITDELKSDDADALLAAIAATVDGNVVLEQTDGGVILRHDAAITEDVPLADAVPTDAETSSEPSADAVEENDIEEDVEADDQASEDTDPVEIDEALETAEAVAPPTQDTDEGDLADATGETETLEDPEAVDEVALATDEVEDDGVSSEETALPDIESVLDTSEETELEEPVLDVAETAETAAEDPETVEEMASAIEEAEDDSASAEETVLPDVESLLETSEELEEPVLDVAETTEAAVDAEPAFDQSLSNIRAIFSEGTSGEADPSASDDVAAEDTGTPIDEVVQDALPDVSDIEDDAGQLTEVEATETISAASEAVDDAPLEIEEDEVVADDDLPEDLDLNGEDVLQEEQAEEPVSEDTPDPEVLAEQVFAQDEAARKRAIEDEFLPGTGFGDEAPYMEARPASEPEIEEPDVDEPAVEEEAPLSKGAAMLAAHFAQTDSAEDENPETDLEPEEETAQADTPSVEPVMEEPAIAEAAPSAPVEEQDPPEDLANFDTHEDAEIDQAPDVPDVEVAAEEPAAPPLSIASPRPPVADKTNSLQTDEDRRALVSRIARRAASENIASGAAASKPEPVQDDDKMAAINKLRAALKKSGAAPAASQPSADTSPATPPAPQPEASKPETEKPLPVAKVRKVTPEEQSPSAPPETPPAATQDPADNTPKPVLEQIAQNTKRMAEMTPEERLSSRNLAWGDVDDLADRHFEKASTEKTTVPDDELVFSDPNAEREAQEAEETARKAEQKRARRAVLTEDGDDKEGFVERLMNATSYLLKDDRSTNRRASIAHMKAAVAATKADSSIKNNSLAQEEKEMDAYRQDLARAVDRTPDDKKAEAHSSRERSQEPQPEEPPKRLTDDPESDVINQVAQALQGSALGDKARAYIDKLDEEAQIGATIPEPSLAADSERITFKDYATKANALELPDLMEAAAAYLTYVEGTPYFTRPTLLRKAATVSPSGGGLSREAGLRSFGKLLREGKLQNSKEGKYSISKGNKYEPHARYAG